MPWREEIVNVTWCPLGHAWSFRGRGEQALPVGHTSTIICHAIFVYLHLSHTDACTFLRLIVIHVFPPPPPPSIFLLALLWHNSYSDQTWLAPSNDPLLHKILNRSRTLAMLPPDAHTEALQVVRYDIEGHYESHFDSESAVSNHWTVAMHRKGREHNGGRKMRREKVASHTENRVEEKREERCEKRDRDVKEKWEREVGERA